MNTSKLNTNLSTLNFALPFVGYAVATSLFIPMTSEMERITSAVTVPYRAFTLGISLLVLMLNLRNTVSLTSLTKWFLLFWILLLCRMFYDLEVRSDFFILRSDKTRLWLYALLICCVNLISVIKSIKQIDLNKIFPWVFFSLFGVLLVQLNTNASLMVAAEELSQRVDANQALNTISFGHYAAMSVILCISYYQRYGHKIWQKFFVAFVVIISLFVMMRAGSRGPLLSLFVALLAYSFSISKRRMQGVAAGILVLSIVFLFSDALLEIIRAVSPVMYNRMELTINEGHTSGRDGIYLNAIDTFMNNPIFGGQFCLSINGKANYSHNSILDAFMGMGLLGGLLFCYILFRCFTIAHQKLPILKGYEWIFLILIQRIIAGMTSGAFYYDQLLTVLIGFVFMSYTDVQPRISRRKHSWYDS